MPRALRVLVAPMIFADSLLRRYNAACLRSAQHAGASDAIAVDDAAPLLRAFIRARSAVHYADGARCSAA